MTTRMGSPPRSNSQPVEVVDIFHISINISLRAQYLILVPCFFWVVLPKQSAAPQTGVDARVEMTRGLIR